MRRNLVISAVGTMALALSAPVKAQNAITGDPITVTPAAVKSAIPNLSHLQPEWAMSAPVAGFDPPTPVQTTKVGRAGMPAVWATVFSGGTVLNAPLRVRTVTIRADGAETPAAQVPRLNLGPPDYFVQISAYRRKADAESSLQRLRATYPNQIGNRPGVVRRFDLGPRGIYFRGLLGPYWSRQEADDVCTALKAAGGQCIVH